MIKKYFNTTGNCLPDKHYMMDNSRQLVEVLELVETGQYLSDFKFMIL